MIYVIPVRFTGKIEYEIEADTEEEAIAIANKMGEYADCGDLEDIDWETKPAVATYDE